MYTDLLKKAKRLRLSGKSYSEISNKLNISKSTLSNWFSNKEWSKEIKTRLNRKQKRNSKSSLKLANEARQLKKKRRHANYRKEAKLEYKVLKNNPLFLAGLGIYWGEGEKTNQGRVSVINTNPDLLETTVNFYRGCLEVPDKKLRIALFLYEDIKESAAKDFWSKKLKIPQSQFIKTQVLKSRSKLTRRKSKYGICNLYFSSTKLSIKIAQWLKMLARDMRE